MTRQRSITPDIRSSAIEYLTFIAATDKSKRPVIRNFLITGNDDKNDIRIAKAHALNEFEQYRLIQDKQYQSDFDRAVQQRNTESGSNNNE